MTAQIPEKLINNKGGVEFGAYKLFSIFIGEPSGYKNRKAYPFKQKGKPQERAFCTACWRGYVSVYELKASGELYLVKFEYPFSSRKPDAANEVLEGDFWIELRAEFFGDTMFVPFRNGKIVNDRSKWREVKRT
ncbi:hypothetical protein [Halomonas ramblicola]|uniref:hypothetical protein n=1 Tax=Halomonas ramblicola TaxID=747349 RepID=UPI0025B56D43|nr:hypothetical protein [Halomonas ramblicola]MDN3523083.1 hypothetical protein [Halomonas ramblicola]